MTPNADKPDKAASLRQQFLKAGSVLPRSAVKRLWKTGRSAAGMAAATLGSRLKGGDGSLGDADLEWLGSVVTQLGELKGVAMKAGQILSFIDPSMPDEVRRVLALLQTQSPASPLAVVQQTIRDAMGERAEILLGTFDPTPLAVASIGQVHRATLPDGRPVAVKVLHAGIEEALRNDFKTASGAVGIISVMMPGSDIKSFVDEARTGFTEECDYHLEADRQETFARLFERDADIIIPSVERDLSAKSVLTTQWCSGRSLESVMASNPSQAERNRWGKALFRFYVGTLYQHGLFHADPHPGNQAFADDGRIIIYDFGCVRTFDRASIQALARLVAAVRSDDAGKMLEALRALGADPADDDENRTNARALLRAFFAPLLLTGERTVNAGISMDGRQMFKDKRAMARLRLPGKILFLFRIRFGLYALLSRLGAVGDWGAMESAWAAQVG